MEIMNFEEFRSKISDKSLLISKFSDKIAFYNNFISQLETKYNKKEIVYDIESIKKYEYQLSEIMKDCIYNILKNKKDEVNYKHLTETIDQFIILSCGYIYKHSFEAFKTYLQKIYNKSNKLKDIKKLQTFSFKYNQNYYKNKKNVLFDKIRFIYNNLNTKENKTIENLLDLIERNSILHETGLELIYSIYFLCTKSHAIDNETRRRFYKELMKLFVKIINSAYSDCIIYYVVYKQFSYNDLFIENKLSIIKKIINLYKNKQLKRLNYDR